MSWEDVNGVFHTHKGQGISVCEVSTYYMPEDGPENHADHDDSYYWVGMGEVPEVEQLLKLCNITKEMYSNMKVVLCTPRSNTLTIVDGQASVEPDFFNCSEDVYWFDEEGKQFDWELNEEEQWEKVYA